MSRPGVNIDLPLHGGHVLQCPMLARVLDHTTGVLEQAMRRARLGNAERLQAIAWPDAQVRRLEATAHSPSVQDCIAPQRRDASRCGGRNVSGRKPASAISAAAPPVRVRADWR
ncbi:hypothetical protein XmelCFBP4644_00760 [Xanthomonas melonis]|uniref:Uncharacterized protein n=1 Tax=Xanthomonas melonis TaxID=56456 RepID=A0A2S7DL47_9XANT|nr:hypothetical protein XmelCFBP4644_00760 [Xanthomonas melonis]